eukprot:TRINITY_DN26914_c0_g1_i1.p1 TRINITY_DN26914_c0_g1~~TRINITY_DN26914_c0_g1_i1.p1  ORF type:complete len:635 (+),score=212.57 TRINITY_DN26914_c0_g1_i1:39-1943(+)
MDIPTEGKLLAALIASFASWKWVDGKYHLSHDLGAISRLASVYLEANKNFKTPGWSIVDMWAKTRKEVSKTKVALISADTGATLTFQQVEEQSNQVANWACTLWKPGQCVALYMENDPIYIVTWLGLAKAGVEIALINSNIKGKALLHSTQIASAVGIIYHSDISENVHNVEKGFRENGVKTFAIVGDAPSVDGGINFLQQIATFPTKKVNAKERRGHLLDAGHAFGYIYTSGTTGLPKACKISHMKMNNYAIIVNAFGCQATDVIYGSGMPLYHTAANLGVMSMMNKGCTYIIRKKFSASRHWSDCIKYKATVMQYIGELCRYLLAADPKPEEKKHRLRIAIGNGLRPEIWDTFQRRNNIPEIGEFYGATEGNAFLFNFCRNYEGQGAVGKTGAILQAARPMYIVKFDVENEMPIRNKAGFCEIVEDNQPGELISPIKMVKTATGSAPDFEGYTNKEATEKKIMRDVFVKGDSYFRTGDLLRKTNGYTYFVDRIGDTFRWKGENVSTMEVSEVLSTFPGIIEASVYGVEVPGKDGRACMVAINQDPNVPIDPRKFATYCRANLPMYSVPMFVRFLAQMDSTGTFKHMKVQYKKESFDPKKCSDKMWFFDIPAGTYSELNENAFERICSGQAKL